MLGIFVKTLARFCTHLGENQKGATAIEYGLIAALIAVAAIGAFQALGDTVSGMFNSVVVDVEGAISGGGGSRPPVDANPVG